MPQYLPNKEFQQHVVQFQQIKADRSRFRMWVDDIKTMPQPVTPRMGRIIQEANTIEAEYRRMESLLVHDFTLLADNICAARKYPGFDLEDMRQDLLIVAFDKLDRFDGVKGKAFNWFTTVMINVTRQGYRNANTYNAMRHKFFDEMKRKHDF